MANQLAAKARAAGIHLFLATQLPNATTIPQKVRANAARLALRMDSFRESVSVLGRRGAENLGGQGHGLLKFDGSTLKMRTIYVEKKQIDAAILYAKTQYSPKEAPARSRKTAGLLEAASAAL